MKKIFILVLISLIAFSCPLKAQDKTIPCVHDENAEGFPKPVNASNSLAVKAMNSISLATSSYVVLATSTVTYLQNVSSFTAGISLVQVQVRSKAYYLPLSKGQTVTAANLQATGFVMDAGEQERAFRLKGSADIAFVADSNSVATMPYSIIKE